MYTSRPNTDLSPAEREAKRHLKQQLKQKARLRKYETRLQTLKTQASTRGDQVLAARARQELEDYFDLLARYLLRKNYRTKSI